MPLLVGEILQPPPPTIPPEAGTVEFRWTSPSGVVVPLDTPSHLPGVHVLAGATGLGAAPVEVTSLPLPGAGEQTTHTYILPRTINLPLMFHAPADQFRAVRSAVRRAFKETVPKGAPTTQGVLRITRTDGEWRECNAYYVMGFEGESESEQGTEVETVVLQLRAPDPAFYGQQFVALIFRPSEARSYFNPYETVTPTNALGEQTIEVLGDQPASPVWTLTGPMTSVSARITDGPNWTFQSVAENEVVTIDVNAGTITNADGVNRAGSLLWPVSELFDLPVGSLPIETSMAGGVVGASSIGLSYRPRLDEGL